MNKRDIDIKIEQWVRKICKDNDIKTTDNKFSLFRREAVFERYWLYIIRYNNKVIGTLRIDTRTKIRTT